MQLLADGFTQPEAARELGISINTVKHSLCKARDGAGMDTTCSLVAWGFRHDLLT